MEIIYGFIGVAMIIYACVAISSILENAENGLQAIGMAAGYVAGGCLLAMVLKMLLTTLGIVLVIVLICMIASRA